MNTRAEILASSAAGLFMRATTLLAVGCASVATEAPKSSILVAHLGDRARSFDTLRAAFRESNPGYDMDFHHDARVIRGTTAPRVLFVQAGEGRADVTETQSQVATGDIVLLRAGQELSVSAALDLLAFSLPEPFPASLPTFIRPDWDAGITDQPGGCATESGAYRRILLTWLEQNGVYLYRSLNAHRVRITDSFTHYHPSQGGFDELYLVQMVQPGAHVLTSDAVDAIENRTLSAKDAAALFDVTPLAVGDLVYLPRGTIHRGLGGFLAQVIAVPGFVPGTEIPVDEHLRAINGQLGLVGEAALPFHR